MYQPDPDALLVQRCLRHNRQAQFELYERFQTQMFGLCLRYAKSETEALDFLQEGFVAVFKSLPQYRGEGSLEGWIRRIMTNVCISKLRKKKPVFVSLEELPEMAVCETEKPANAFADVDASSVILAIQQLPLGYQTIFNLYAIEGYSHREIAGILDIKESTSRSQYVRARQALIKILHREKSLKNDGA